VAEDKLQNRRYRDGMCLAAKLGVGMIFFAGAAGSLSGDPHDIVWRTGSS
jgi:hypothetical protein